LANRMFPVEVTIGRNIVERVCAILEQKSLITITVDATPSRVQPNQEVTVRGLVSFTVFPIPFRNVTIHVCDETMREIKTLTATADIQGKYEAVITFADVGRYNIYSTTRLAKSNTVIVEVYAPPPPAPEKPPSVRIISYGIEYRMETWVSYKATGHNFGGRGVCFIRIIDPEGQVWGASTERGSCEEISTGAQIRRSGEVIIEAGYISEGREIVQDRRRDYVEV